MSVGTRPLRLAIAVSIALALLSACQTTGMSSPEVIAGDSDTVSIATGKFIDPTETADDYCAGHGREAVYFSRGPLSKSGMMDLYIYNCIVPGTTPPEPSAAEDQIEEVQE